MLNDDVKWTAGKGGKRCRKAWSLQGVIAHEMGHSFGLAHVDEGAHGTQTMSTLSNGTCQDSESTLGKGDVRALRRLY